VDASGNVTIRLTEGDSLSTNTAVTLVKLSSNGTLLWTNRAPDSYYQCFEGPVLNNAGDAFLAISPPPQNGEDVDSWLIKYSPNGSSVSTNRYDSQTADGNDYVSSIAADRAGNVYVTGSSGGDVGTTDFATIKYSDYVRYTPPPNFIGTDSFTFTVFDAFGNSATGAVNIAVLPPGLRFDINPSNFLLTPQGLQLKVTGAQGTNPIVLFASTNLVNWEAIRTNPAASGYVQFLDPAATNLTKRFYRALQGQ
jgi:hypothetical protein